jgi:hypothetical protein
MTEEYIENYEDSFTAAGALLGYQKNKDYENYRYNAQEGMIKFGGSFVHALGHALAHADSNNTFKILSTFAEYAEEHAGLWIKFRMNDRGE